MHQVITLYALNLHSIICLFISIKLERKRKNRGAVELLTGFLTSSIDSCLACLLVMLGAVSVQRACCMGSIQQC